MATQTLDEKGNVVVDGMNTNVTPSQFQAISTNAFTPTKPLSIPQPQPQDVSGIVGQEIANIGALQTKYDTANTQASDIYSQLAGLSTQNKESDLATAYQTGGVNDAASKIRQLNAQAQALDLEAQAVPLQVQQESIGRGRTEAGIAPLQTARLRENALKALSLGQQAALAQADYQTAKDKADQMITIKYADIENQINTKKLQLDALDRFVLTPTQERLKEARALALKKEERELEESKATEKAISDIGMTLGKYGADQSTIQDVLSSKNIKDAIIKAGSKLQDPRAKMELESIRIDQLIKRAELAKIQRATALLGQPTEAEKKAQATALKNVKAQIPALEDKMVLLDGVLSSNAIDSVVGPTFLSRAGGDITGIAGRFIAGATAGAVAGVPFAGVGAIPGAIIGGTALASQGLSDVFGSRQSLISSVNQLTDKAFLDELLSLKERGGTLGQVTEKEGQALRSAASKIGTWEIKNDKGQVIGYNASEKDFKDEINRIRTSTNRILTELRGSQYSAEEQQLLDEIYNSPLNTNASDYFQ